MGQPMSRIFATFSSFFPTIGSAATGPAGEQQQQQQRVARGRPRQRATEYSGDELSSTLGKSTAGTGLTAFFGNHFLMGGELYDAAKPEVFLFGDQQDLDLLGNKPVKFPHSAKGVTDTVNVLNALVNVRKNSVKFTRVGRMGGGYSSGFYRLEFLFDCDVSCFVQIHFCSKEIVEDQHQFQIVSRQNKPIAPSERYHFPVGANQQFSHFVFKPHKYDLKQMQWDGGAYFPVVIEIRSMSDLYPEQVQTTLCSIERSTDQTAALILKPLKQKLISSGVVFLLQEIFGIENKENGDTVLAEENGTDCIICMANPRDTMILPCRHLCICNGCAETLRYKLNNCPICRSPFKALLKIRAVRNNLVGMGSDGNAATVRIRREPLTLFEALNGPFHSSHSTNPSYEQQNKAATVTRCVGNSSNVVTTTTIPHTSTVQIPFKSADPKQMLGKRNMREQFELNIEQIELEELDTRKKIAHSSFIQYSPGGDSITRHSSASPPLPVSSSRKQSSSTANSSYRSARSIAQQQKGQKTVEDLRKEDAERGGDGAAEKREPAIALTMSASSTPNLTIEVECVEEVGAEAEAERGRGRGGGTQSTGEKQLDAKRTAEANEEENGRKERNRIRAPSKRMSEPPAAQMSSSSVQMSPEQGDEMPKASRLPASRLPVSGKPYRAKIQHQSINRF